MFVDAELARSRRAWYTTWVPHNIKSYNSRDQRLACFVVFHLSYLLHQVFDHRTHSILVQILDTSACMLFVKNPEQISVIWVCWVLVGSTMATCNLHFEGDALNRNINMSHTYMNVYICIHSEWMAWVLSLFSRFFSHKCIWTYVEANTRRISKYHRPSPGTHDVQL